MKPSTGLFTLNKSGIGKFVFFGQKRYYLCHMSHCCPTSSHQPCISWCGYGNFVDSHISGHPSIHPLPFIHSLSCFCLFGTHPHPYHTMPTPIPGYDSHERSKEVAGWQRDHSYGFLNEKTSLILLFPIAHIILLVIRTRDRFFLIFAHLAARGACFPRWCVHVTPEWGLGGATERSGWCCYWCNQG